MIMIMIMNLCSSRTIRYSKPLYIKLQLKKFPKKLIIITIIIIIMIEFPSFAKI